MSSPWEDRRGMFQRGKEVHTPGKPMAEFGTRRPSQGGLIDAVRRASTSSSDGLEKTNTTSSAGSPPSPTGQRRRSSAASAKFGNLTNLKRGSEDYGERRASHLDQQPAGVVSGWFNSTFRGMTGSTSAAANNHQASNEDNKKRGVME